MTFVYVQSNYYPFPWRPRGGKWPTAKPGSKMAWLMVAALAFNAAALAFMFMSFLTTATLSASLLNVEPSNLTWLYSAGLISIVAFTLPAQYLLVHHHQLASLLGMILMAMSGWARYIAATKGKFGWALGGFVCSGAAGAVVLSSYTTVSERYFPPSMRQAAVTVPIQANYAAWALVSVLTPAVATSTASLTQMMFYQAIGISCGIPLFLLAHGHAPPPKPSDAATDGAADGEQSTHLAPETAATMSLGRSYFKLLTNLQFVVQALSTAATAAVGITIPSVVDLIVGDGCSGAPTIFHGIDLPPAQTKWINFTYIGCGVVAGLVLGATCRSPRSQAVALRCLFAAAALALAALATLSAEPVATAIFGPALSPLALMVPLAAVAGASTIGFVGLALPAAVGAAAPVSATYSGGAIEMLIQAGGAGLTQASTCEAGLVPLAGVAAAAAIAALGLARYQPAKTVAVAERVEPLLSA